MNEQTKPSGFDLSGARRRFSDFCSGCNLRLLDLSTLLAMMDEKGLKEMITHIEKLNKETVITQRQAWLLARSARVCS